jgi:acyl carrier protein
MGCAPGCGAAAGRVTVVLTMDEPTFQLVRGIAADVLDVDPASLTPQSGPESVEAWDSVQYLSLVLALEQKFDLLFEPPEIDGMKTLGAIADVVARKRNGIRV